MNAFLALFGCTVSTHAMWLQLSGPPPLQKFNVALGNASAKTAFCGTKNTVFPSRSTVAFVVFVVNHRHCSNPAAFTIQVNVTCDSASAFDANVFGKLLKVLSANC